MSFFFSLPLEVKKISYYRFKNRHNLKILIVYKLLSLDSKKERTNKNIFGLYT